MCYANPEEILNFVHNRNLTDIITSTGLLLFWYIGGCFKIVIEEHKTCLKFCYTCLRLAFE